jgi:putative ABC transport system permease protein
VRPSNAFFLYRIRLRSRIVQELLALAGIAVGVALVYAALVANTSLTGSVRQLTESIVGDATLQLAARGSDGLDEQVVKEVRRVDGVATAAPILETRANVVGPDGRSSVLFIGGDPSFSRLGGSLLAHFRDVDLGGDRAIALPTPLADTLGLAFGQRIRLEVNSRAVTTTLGARLDEAEIGALTHHPVALAPLPTVQNLSGMPDRVTRILVRPEPGQASRVEAALERIAGERNLDVDAANAEEKVFAEAAYPTNQSTALFSIFSALVGFLFAFSSVLLTVPQRRRFITDIRMMGHDSRAVVQVLLIDALVLGLAGSLVGLLLGDQLSRHLFDTTPGYLAAAFAIGSQRIVTWESVAIAGAAGLAAACIAVFAPLRDILAYRPHRKRPRRSVVPRLDLQAAVGAIACLVIVTALMLVAPAAALAAMAVLTVALLLLLPLLLRGAAGVCAFATRSLRSVVPTVALQELGSRDSKARTLAVAATGALAVFATVAIGGAHADLERGLDASARDIDRNADIWVTFEGKANILATTPFDDREMVGARLRSIPGVDRAEWYRGSFFDLGERRVWIIAPPSTARHPIPPTQVVDGDVDAASEQVSGGGWVSLSKAVAEDLDVELGDRVALPSAKPVEFRVAAITTNLGWPPGAIVLNADDYAKAWGSEAASALHVNLEPGASPERIAASIKRELSPIPMRVETQAERVDRHYALTREGLSRMTQISVLVLIAAILAMVATMGGMIWQRRKTFAALKVQGFSEGELWSALLLESGLLLGTASLAGAVFGLYGQVLLSQALEVITGFPVFYSLAAVVAVSILGIATLVAVTMLAIPGWLAVRVRPQRGTSA